MDWLAAARLHRFFEVPLTLNAFPELAAEAESG